MNIFILLLSLAVLSECNLNEGNFPPVTTASTTTENYDWAVLNDFLRKLLKQTSPQPTSSPHIHKLTQTNTTPEPDPEISEELIAAVFKEAGPEAVGSSPQVPSRLETSTPSYSPNLPSTTGSPSLPLSLHENTKPHAKLTSNNYEGPLLPFLYQQLESFSHPASNHFQYSQPSVPQQQSFPSVPQQQSFPSVPQEHESFPPFQYIPPEIPLPYNPSSFYNQPDSTLPAVSSYHGFPHYPPSNTPDEMPISSSTHSVPYQSSMIPLAAQEQSFNHEPHVNNDPLNYGPVPSIPMITGANSGPPQYLQFADKPLQYYGTPTHIASFVRTYIPQDQFYPLQFQAPQPSLQHPGYVPQLSDEDIISIIQNSHVSPVPVASSPFSNPLSFPPQSYSEQPHIDSVPSSSGKVSGPYSSSSVKTSVPFPFYREPRTSIRSYRSNLGSSLLENSPRPVNVNPRNIHFI